MGKDILVTSGFINNDVIVTDFGAAGVRWYRNDTATQSLQYARCPTRPYAREAQ